MISNMALILGGISSLAKVLIPNELPASAEQVQKLSREEFATLVDRLVESIMDRHLENKISETAENSSAPVDADQYLQEKQQLENTMESALFRSLDVNANGRLEGGEVEKLDDFLANFDRELLMRNRAGEDDSPLEVLNDLLKVV